MADDYIGKKMEDYRRGINPTAYRRKMTPTGAKAGVWEVKFPPRRVFVEGAADGDREADAVRELRKAGCRVAFCGSDTRGGRTLAEATGAQYYPTDDAASALRRVADAWGGIDVIVGREAARLAMTTAPDEGGRIIVLGGEATADSDAVGIIGTGRPGAIIAFLCSAAGASVCGTVEVRD